MSRQYCFRTSPQNILLVRFIVRTGVFLRHTNMPIRRYHDGSSERAEESPAPYVSCIMQAACSDFDQENAMGSSTA